MKKCSVLLGLWGDFFNIVRTLMPLGTQTSKHSETNLQRAPKMTPQGLGKHTGNQQKQSRKLAQTIALQLTSRKIVVGSRRSPARRNTRSASNKNGRQGNI